MRQVHPWPVTPGPSALVLPPTGAVTGTVEARSIVESTRSLLRGKGVYHEAECVDVDPERKVLHCRYNKPSRLLAQVDCTRI